GRECASQASVAVPVVAGETVSGATPPWNSGFRSNMAVEARSSHAIAWEKKLTLDFSKPPACVSSLSSSGSVSMDSYLLRSWGGVLAIRRDPSGSAQNTVRLVVR